MPIRAGHIWLTMWKMYFRTSGRNIKLFLFRYIAHRVHDCPFHDLACQQPQRPGVGALRRRTKSRRDDAGLLVARQQLLSGRLFTLNAVECFIESVLDESLAKSFNGSRPTRVGLGDALVDPIWTTGVGL